MYLKAIYFIYFLIHCIRAYIHVPKGGKEVQSLTKLNEKNAFKEKGMGKGKGRRLFFV